MVRRNFDADGDTAAVEQRTTELMAEFEQHFQDTIELEPLAKNRREYVFHAWTFQKLAGIQVSIEEIVKKFNQHVDAT